MNKKHTFSAATLLLALSTSGLADMPLSSGITYCPTVADLTKTLCHPKGQFNQEQIKFPSCLILLKGEVFTFQNGLMWEIMSVSPSITDYTQLSFYSAYFNERGAFCAYASQHDDTLLRLQYVPKHNALQPVANGHWQQDVQNKRSNYEAGTFDSQYHYICQTESSDKGDVTLCPLHIVPQNNAKKQTTN